MRSNMPTGPNVLPPLSEFTVRSYGPRDHLKRRDLFVWMDEQDVRYIVDHQKQKVYVYGKQPNDCNPMLTEMNYEDGWTVIWDAKQ